MLLLQFSTSHYCRKARLAIGYKQIPFQVENLTPGLHILRIKPLSGLKTVPVLLPQQKNCPAVVADSTEIIRFLEAYKSEPPLYLENIHGFRFKVVNVNLSNTLMIACFCSES